MSSEFSFMEDEQVAASFTADAERRIIGGILVPWNKIAKAGGARWRFAKGSLRWADTSRVKLNLNHDRRQAVGKAVRLHNTIDGLEGTFKIARGEEGDRALTLAEDGVLDGFSIEVDFDDGDEWRPDREDRSVRDVVRGRLVGAALTGFPAFDDARADRIAAARQEGEHMSEEHEQQEPTSEAEGTLAFEQHMSKLAESFAASQERFAENLTATIGESVSAGMQVAIENMQGSQGPSSVRAARFDTLKEPAVYRFDGRGPSLVRDAWAAINDRGTASGDEAAERIAKFRRQSEEMTEVVTSYLAFTPQSTSSASQIIPPGYRPDLYVAELTRGRPMISGVSRGSIDNAAPFTVPVFGSSSGVSADHVEGTNPSDGSVTFTTKTVTPQGISGRLVLTRELVDSSNPAIDQIAFATMRESYARQTETKLYTLLNGTSGAGGTITTDNVPSGAMASTTAGGTDNQTLVKHIRERLAKYPFQRFLYPTTATMGQAATVRLANAVDTTQRPLFPWTDGQNAPGAANTATGGYQVDSLVFQPAWANTGVAAGDSQILIWNSADVWVWESPLLTFRFEEKQGPANIELNIFGYFGTHLLRPVGLSGIRIT
jgi:HK97 family phage prohead protease